MQEHGNVNVYLIRYYVSILYFFILSYIFSFFL
jgi:hypothetical protein